MMWYSETPYQTELALESPHIKNDMVNSIAFSGVHGYARQPSPFRCSTAGAKV